MAKLQTILTHHFFWHEFSMSKRSSVLIFALYIRWKSLSKYLWRRKLQRYAFFFFLLWRQFLALLINNACFISGSRILVCAVYSLNTSVLFYYNYKLGLGVWTHKVNFQVHEFLNVQSIVWILLSYFITFSLEIGFGGLDLQS